MESDGDTDYMCVLYDSAWYAVIKSSVYTRDVILSTASLDYQHLALLRSFGLLATLSLPCDAIIETTIAYLARAPS